MLLDTINPFAVVVASLIGYAFCALWYSPYMFERVWLEGLGVTTKDLEKSKGYLAMATTYSLIIILLTTFTLSIFLTLSGTETLISKIQISTLLAVGFIVTTKFNDMLFSVREPFWSMRAQKLFFVESAYYVALFTIVTFVLHALAQ